MSARKNLSKNLCIVFTPSDPRRSIDLGEAERRSFHHHRMVVFAGRRRASQQQDEGNGGKRKDHHQLEIVDVADDGSLRLDGLIERRASACGPGTQSLPHNAVVEGVIEGCDMAGDGRVIDLIVSDQQIGDDRYPDAGSDVTGEVEETGAVRPLLGRKRSEGDGVERDEQESKSRSLDESGYCDLPLRD